MYNVLEDREKRFIRIEIQGLITADEEAAIYEDIAKQQAAHLPGTYDILIDCTRAAIQVQKTIAKSESLISHRRWARRVAFAHGDSLIRMQTRRLVNDDDSRSFRTVEEAEQWLLE